MEELDDKIDNLEKDNKKITEIRKLFRYFEFDIPSVIKKKLDAREKKNNDVLNELVLKKRRIISETKEYIENLNCFI